MKELTIEEKAKRYDETIKNLRDFYRDYDIVSSLIDVKEELANLIPELKESEDKDERIRKEMIFYFTEEIPQCSIQEHADKMKEFIAWLEKQGTSYTKKDVDDAYVEGIAFAKDELKKQYEANYQIRKDIATFIFNYKGDIKDRAKWIDYLGIKVSFAEDQGEQKPADKVEAKFKVEKGKWYVCTNTFVSRGKIIAFKGQTYQSQQEDDTITCEDNCLFIDKHDGKASDYFRLWTINDAKDGDVLIDVYGNIGIYKSHDDFDWTSYCDYNRAFRHFEIEHESEKTYPATKEQRDLLFTKMKEAGYEWDTEKRVLKKLAHQESSAWSEEDSRKIETLLSIIFDYAFYKDALDENKDLTGEYAELSDWLQFFPERFNLQPKQEWSKEDKARIKQLFGWLDTLKNYIHYDAFVSLALRRKRVDEVSGLEHWIKSLKDRVQLHNK